MLVVFGGTMKLLYLFALMGFFTAAGCTGGEEDLRGVPVTNNPTLLPTTSQTAQGPGF
jgi:hypothetical protein